MKKKMVKYTNESLGKIKIVDDFLPKPKDLVFKDENVKITLFLNKSTVDFFKKQATKHHSRYQKMIRTLLDRYTEHYRQSNTEHRKKASG